MCSHPPKPSAKLRQSPYTAHPTQSSIIWQTVQLQDVILPWEVITPPTGAGQALSLNLVNTHHLPYQPCRQLSSHDISLFVTKTTEGVSFTLCSIIIIRIITTKRKLIIMMVMMMTKTTYLHKGKKYSYLFIKGHVSRAPKGSHAPTRTKTMKSNRLSVNCGITIAVKLGSARSFGINCWTLLVGDSPETASIIISSGRWCVHTCCVFSICMGLPACKWIDKPTWSQSWDATDGTMYKD
jgi:hypothetical protein